jgi:polyferredoxin
MQTRRRIAQLGFLTLTFIGVFVFGNHAERWCPFGGIETLHTYATEGNFICSLGVSNLYILVGVLVMTLILRRAFCGYMCPIGTISEWLRMGAARLGLAQVRLSNRLDRGLSLLKYALLVVILLFTYQASELVFRRFDPCYALISRHGEDITFWAYAAAGAIILGSLFLVMPFCRWLCPLGAVLNPFSRFALARIKRKDTACSACTKCAEVCPMAIPIDEVLHVTHARCLSCLNCVEACPERSQDAISWGPPAWLGRTWPQAVLLVILLFCTTAAVAATYLFPLPSFVKTRGEMPTITATTDLEIQNLSCRGKANLLMYYLERDDVFELSRYLRLEAWPGPHVAHIRITYDPSLCDELAIKQAITETYHDPDAGIWRHSPFKVEGYDLLGP